MFERENLVVVVFATLQQIYCQRFLLSSISQIFLLIYSSIADYNNNYQKNPSNMFGCSLPTGIPMCCSGRNSSCKSMEYPAQSTIYRFNINPSDISPVYCRPKRQIYSQTVLNNSFTLQNLIIKNNATTNNESAASELQLENIRIGFTNILPGLVAISPAGQQLLNKLGINNLNERNLRLFEITKPKKRRKGRRRKRLSKGQEELIIENQIPQQLNKDYVFHFGWPVEHWDIENFDKLITDEQGWPLIRYSLLNKYLPLRVLKRSHTMDVVKGRQQTIWHTFNVAEAPKECFCDQMCVKYGDCCGDYAYRCPAVDCLISQWTSWSDCFVEMPEANCGLGFRERHRQVLNQAENGGIECPSSLTQQIGCFKQCEANIEERVDLGEEEEYTRPDVTTVALLLDYRFNKSRKFLPRHLKKTQIGFNRRRTKGQYKNYCVIYTIEWLNRNCIENEWSDKLSAKKRICGECQPEAQYHRPRERCASDLEDGQTGFWKLIGPTSCYGIWRRHYSDQNDCNCSQSYPQFEPFLLV